MNAEEARTIWEREVEDKAKVFIEFIKNKILKYTYQDNVLLYYFEFPDLPKNISGSSEAQEGDFILGVFERIASYFQQLGFKVKSDSSKFAVWITFLKRDALKSDAFTDNLTNIIKVRSGYRGFIEVQDILKEIEKEIRIKAKRSRTLCYALTLNVPNERSLSLEDLIVLIKNIEERGFILLMQGDLESKEGRSNMETVEECISEGLCFQEMGITIIIRW